jgi:hypothetical protein
MLHKLPKNDWRSTWIKLGFAAIVVRVIFGFFPSWCEVLYSRGIYPYIRSFLDMTFGQLPFAGVYIFAGFLALWIPYVLINFVRNRIKGVSLKETFFSFSAFLMGLIFWFLLIWGYNYARIPVAEHMQLAVPEFMKHDDIWAEAQYIKQKCIETRNKIPQLDTNAITPAHYPDDLETIMRPLLEAVLAEYGYDVSGEVSGRLLLPKGTLFRFSSSGVYFPFTGEGHIDAALPPMNQPFTMAHELAHGYGFGNEAVCNFLGYLACIRSEDPAIQYAGYLTYWRYVYGELMAFVTEEDYNKERATISRGMYNDLELLYETLDSYPPFIPYIQQTTYDLFLKAQGIEEGIESYNEVVLWVSAWRKKYER